MSAEDYLTDTPYTWGFYGDFGPQNLRHVAMMCGFACPDPRKGFRFLELGCGNGVSLATYAACFPEGEFLGVDLNPEHARNASRLAREACLDNVSIHEASCANFAAAEVGEFDFVALHGLWSWVGPDVRAQIRDILDRKLRPGGLAYVSYNAMPGWAPMLPLRQIMLAYTRDLDVPTDEKVRRALQYLVYLRDNGSAYFADNTAAHRKLDELLGYDPAYVAHEFFPKHWTAFAVEDVARDLATSGLEFGGTIPASLNIRQLAVPEKFRSLLDTARSRLDFETHKSFVSNETFRRDVFVKAPATRLEGDPRAAWGDTLFGPLVLEQDVKLEHEFPAGRVTYTDPVYPALVRLLLPGVVSFAELCDAPELSAWEPLRILHSLHFLCASEQFGVFRSAMRPSAVPDRFRLAHPLNRVLLRERLLPDGHADLASPVVGTGVRLGMIAGLLVLANEEAPEELPEDWAVRFLRESGRALKVEGDAVVGEDAHRALLRERFESFREERLPRVAAFGIADPV